MARKRATSLITDFDNIPADALVPEDEQPYEIPAHWKWVRLGAAVQTSGDKTETFDGSEKYVGLEHLEKGGGLIGFGDVSTLKSAKSIFKPGQLLYGKLRPYLDKHVIVDFNGVCSTDILVYEESPLIEMRWFEEWVSSDFFIEQANAGTKGINLPRVSDKYLATTPFALPPIDEQKAIVEKLQATNQRIDDVLERLGQFLDQAPRQRAAIIQAGVAGALSRAWREERGRTMDAWLSTTVQELGGVVTGGTPPTKDPVNYGPGIAFVKPTDLNQGRHVVGAEATLSAVGAERSRVLPPNSVAMCCIGATITKAGLIEVESATNQQINVVVPNDDSDPVFVYYLFESTAFKQQVLENSSATTLPIINKGRFSRLPISVPPKSEQTEIAMKLDVAMTSIERAVEVATVAKGQLELTRSVVRARALRGLALTAMFSNTMACA